MAENRPLQVLREAAMEDARVAAQQLVEQGWPVELHLESIGPGIERVEIRVTLPKVSVHAQPVEARRWHWSASRPWSEGL